MSRSFVEDLVHQLSAVIGDVLHPVSLVGQLPQDGGYALRGVQSSGVADAAGIGAGLPDEDGDLPLGGRDVPELRPVVGQVGDPLDPVLYRDGTFHAALLRRVAHGVTDDVPVDLWEGDVRRNVVLAESDLVVLVIVVVPGDGDGMDDRDVQDAAVVVLLVDGSHPLGLAGVRHD